jgi:hypothetical protein
MDSRGKFIILPSKTGNIKENILLPWIASGMISKNGSLKSELFEWAAMMF